MEISIKLPKTWNELTQRQLIRLAKLLHGADTTTQNGLMVFYVRAFKILMDVRWWQFAKGRNCATVIKNVPLSELTMHFAFLIEKNDRTIFPEINRGLYAPRPRLGNLSAEEFAFCEDLHRRWMKEKEVKLLHYMAGALYSKTTPVRQPFIKELMDVRASRFKNVPQRHLLAMEIAYSGCKNHIAAKFPYSFPKNSKGGGKGAGFGKVILQMAGGKFGAHESTKATNVYTFLEEFEENLRTAEKQKQ